MDGKPFFISLGLGYSSDFKRQKRVVAIQRSIGYAGQLGIHALIKGFVRRCCNFFLFFSNRLQSTFYLLYSSMTGVYLDDNGRRCIWSD